MLFATCSQYLNPVAGDCHGVFPLRRQATVLGDGGPTVTEDTGSGFAGVDHWLDRKGHALPQCLPGARLPVVQYLRFFVEGVADTMATEITHYGVVIFFCVSLYNVAYVAEGRAWAHHLDGLVQALLGDAHQALGMCRGFAGKEHFAGVAVPAILDDGDVDINDVALFQGLAVGWYTVADHFVDRSADGFGEAAVAEAGGNRFLYIDYVVVAALVQFFRSDSGDDILANHFQDLCSEATCSAHLGDLFRGLDG